MHNKHINLFSQATGYLCFLPQLFDRTLGDAALKLQHSNSILSSWNTLTDDILTHNLHADNQPELTQSV